MNISLSVLERVQIPGLLKTQGKFDEMVARADILEKAKFKAEEIEKIELKQTDAGHITWNQTKESPLDIDLTELELNFIRKCLKDLSDQEKLPLEAVSLWKKVIV